MESVIPSEPMVAEQCMFISGLKHDHVKTRWRMLSCLMLDRDTWKSRYDPWHVAQIGRAHV